MRLTRRQAIADAATVAIDLVEQRRASGVGERLDGAQRVVEGMHGSERFVGAGAGALLARVERHRRRRSRPRPPRSRGRHPPRSTSHPHAIGQREGVMALMNSGPRPVRRHVEIRDPAAHHAHPTATVPAPNTVTSASEPRVGGPEQRQRNRKRDDGEAERAPRRGAARPSSRGRTRRWRTDCPSRGSRPARAPTGRSPPPAPPADRRHRPSTPAGRYSHSRVIAAASTGPITASGAATMAMLRALPATSVAGPAPASELVGERRTVGPEAVARHEQHGQLDRAADEHGATAGRVAERASARARRRDRRRPR